MRLCFNGRLSVCLLGTSCQTTDDRDIRENFTMRCNLSVNKEDIVKCWKSPVGLSAMHPNVGIFRDSSTLRDGNFSRVWLISLENLIG